MWNKKGSFFSFCLFRLFVVNVVVVFFLPWHSRVEQFALTPDNLIENLKSLRNADVFASYLKCCWSITKDWNWSAQAEPFERKFLHECFQPIFKLVLLLLLVHVRPGLIYHESATRFNYIIADDSLWSRLNYFTDLNLILNSLCE